MSEIKLTQGKYALVDDEDFEWLNQWKWCYDGQYAASRISGKKIRMHRMIMGNSNLQVDHRDMDKLNNQRCNLRFANNSENNSNKGPQPNNTSGHKGVHWNKNARKWQAQTKMNGHRYHLGYFNDINDAVVAYRLGAKKYHGEYINV